MDWVKPYCHDAVFGFITQFIFSFKIIVSNGSSFYTLPDYHYMCWCSLLCWGCAFAFQRCEILKVL